MKKFVLGRGGTQPFPIADSKTRVSREHALLTVSDDGRWILEGLDSANGTYIVDENGELIKIKKVAIQEFTRIVLGDQTKMGFTFLAHHVIEDDPSDYRREFRHVMDIHSQALREKADLDEKERKKANLRYLPSIISALIGLLLTFLLPSEMKPYSVSFTVIITTLLTVIVNKTAANKKGLKRFNSHYSKLLLCPKCGRLLTENDFNNQMCCACQAHA